MHINGRGNIIYVRETEEGVNTMCEIWEEVRNEGDLRARIDVAKSLLNEGTLSLEKIAECSGISIEKVRELAGNKSA